MQQVNLHLMENGALAIITAPYLCYRLQPSMSRNLRDSPGFVDFVLVPEGFTIYHGCGPEKVNWSLCFILDAMLLAYLGAVQISVS